MLLMALMAPWATAQVSLDYFYGFEDGNLSTDGWSSTVTGTNSGIFTAADAVHSGSYGYGICYNEGEDRYLMSPVLTGAGDKAINVTFYYKSYNTNWYDQFQVGYTDDSTITDPSEFTYGSTIAETTADWVMYDGVLPA